MKMNSTSHICLHINNQIDYSKKGRIYPTTLAGYVFIFSKTPSRVVMIFVGI